MSMPTHGAQSDAARVHGASITEDVPSLEFISGASPTWRSLDHHIQADDDEAEQWRNAESSVRDELSLIVGAETLVILAGLGTSMSVTGPDGGTVGAPRMSDLWNDLILLDSYGAAATRLNPKLISEANFEHVLSDAQARVALDPECEELKHFIKEAQHLVWKRCSFVDDDSTLTLHETFLRKVARRSTRLQRTQLFTTNYDLAFETAARRARFNVVDGFGYGGRDFDGSSFDLDFVRRRPNEQPSLEPNVFHLLKLHGSVDWTQTDETVRKVEGEPQTPVLIYPSATKYQLSYQQPYLEFMSRFQIALRQPDVGLIVVGFGFNDDHLVAPIQAALRSNIGLRAIVVDPAARHPDRSPTIRGIEDLVGHGDRRLSILKGGFTDLVLLLPDVPAQEERDAHLDRFAKGSGDARR